MYVPGDLSSALEATRLGVVVSVASGVLMGAFAPFVTRAMTHGVRAIDRRVVGHPGVARVRVRAQARLGISRLDVRVLCSRHRRHRSGVQRVVT